MINIWHCIVKVDIPQGEMPRGSDWPMRQAIENAAKTLHPKTKIVNTCSGWGLSEDGMGNVLNESCKEENTISKSDVEKR